MQNTNTSRRVTFKDNTQSTIQLSDNTTLNIHGFEKATDGVDYDLYTNLSQYIYIFKRGLGFCFYDRESQNATIYIRDTGSLAYYTAEIIFSKSSKLIGVKSGTGLVPIVKQLGQTKAITLNFPLIQLAGSEIVRTILAATEITEFCKTSRQFTKDMQNKKPSEVILEFWNQINNVLHPIKEQPVQKHKKDDTLHTTPNTPSDNMACVSKPDLNAWSAEALYLTSSYPNTLIQEHQDDLRDQSSVEEDLTSSYPNTPKDFSGLLHFNNLASTLYSSGKTSEQQESKVYSRADTKPQYSDINFQNFQWQAPDKENKDPIQQGKVGSRG